MCFCDEVAPVNRAFANTTAAVDFVFWFIAGLAVFLLLLVTGLMIYFAVRYNHQRHPEPKAVRESPLLEITWTLIPVALVLAMFWYGYRAFLTFRAVPADALVVKVTGQMWKWSFEYPNGKRTEVLYVPINKPIKLELKSLDVIHSFYVPAFRIKEDAVPGKANYLWFKPQGWGAADIFCSQYCGLQHSYMISRVEVLGEPDFSDWYASTNTVVATRVDVTQLPGVKLMEAKGCLVCHRLDGTSAAGPSLLGIFGTKVTVVEGGKEKEVVADEDYLRRALLQPSKEIVKGYADVMPPVPNLTEQDLQTMIETLKALK
jgi:cytochrome c oxidase subunit 2